MPIRSPTRRLRAARLPALAVVALAVGASSARGDARSRPTRRGLAHAHEQLVERFGGRSPRRPAGPTLEEFRSKVSALRGDALAGAQDRSLADSLRAHGIEPEEGGRAALTALSARNRARLSRGVHYRSQLEMAGAEALVAKLELRFVHNTVEASRGDAPLLSSKTIREVGFPRGGKNTHSFNRAVMKTDDNVFFFVVPTLGGAIPAGYGPHGADAYGGKRLLLDPTYAEHNAWISRFVMYPDELRAFASERSPELGRRIFRGESAEDRAGRAAGKRAMIEARRSLHEEDFTVSDFTAMLRERLLHELAHLRRRDPKAFSRALLDLESGDPRRIGGVLSRHALSPMGLAQTKAFERAFELKVPVAVPADALTRD
jgi:hypothetical protein